MSADAQFFVLTSKPDPAKDILGKTLAASLGHEGPTTLLSTHPRALRFGAASLDKTPAAERLSESFRRYSSRPNPKMIFALGHEAAGAIRRDLNVKAPWVLIAEAGADVQDESSDHALKAAAVWRIGKARLGDVGWIKRQLERLGKNGASRRPRYPMTSLIIPVYDALPQVRACLESLRRNTHAPHEIIVIDNGSQLDTARYLGSLRGIRLITNKRNLGFSRAINQGMRAARGRYLAWINSDIIASPQWLEAMLDHLQQQEDLAAVGPLTNRIAGPQADITGARQLKARPRDIDVFGSLWSMAHRGEWREVHRLTGFCFVLKRRAFESVGLLDERFGLGCYEDYDYCLRLRQAGFRLAVARDSFVYHHEHASFKTSADHSFMVERNRQVFIDKWCARALDFIDHLDPVLANDFDPAPRRYKSSSAA